MSDQKWKPFIYSHVMSGHPISGYYHTLFNWWRNISSLLHVRRTPFLTPLSGTCNRFINAMIVLNMCMHCPPLRVSPSPNTPPSSNSPWRLMCSLTSSWFSWRTTWGVAMSVSQSCRPSLESRGSPLLLCSSPTLTSKVSVSTSPTLLSWVVCMHELIFWKKGYKLFKTISHTYCTSLSSLSVA